MLQSASVKFMFVRALVKFMFVCLLVLQSASIS